MQMEKIYRIIMNRHVGKATRNIFVFCLFICAFGAAGETMPAYDKNGNTSVSQDSISCRIIELLENIDMRFLEGRYINRYKLYPTENIYNFLKLDTQTGRIEQIQWSLDFKKEGIVTINEENLSSVFSSSAFELYPTKNMYQFILLDKSDGRAWHVQWGLEKDKRWIRRIY